MKRKFLVVVVIIMTVSLLAGCAELFDANTVIERNPFVPIEGTPVPAPNAPLLKTQAPATAKPTVTPDPSETLLPITSTNPKPAPTTQPPVTAVPTAFPTTAPSSEPTPEPTPGPTLIPPVIYIPKIGMLTDDSDNRSYALSVMAWNELEKAALDFGYEPIFMELPAMDDGTIIAHIDILVKDECKVIILPSYRFKGALTKAQILYPETYFVLIEYDGILGDNVVTVAFSEFQAGFMAGVAAAKELSSRLGLETTDFGIIIGENSLSVELYSTGFAEGLNYAANMYHISVSMSAQFIHYLTDQTDIEEAIYAAYGLYDSGVECILNLAGPSASGVISAAIDALQWEVPAYVVGVDYDSYLEGIHDGDMSVVLTSAMKFYGTAVYKIMEAFTNGNFPGGTNMILDLAS
ncbi:MAG: BMP family ABC transporter substrate-binding protein, partial [Clostridiales bacterium]|nr:BMP family ABC transporter substrate-binding protein [Clostridiales bacterium]